MFTKQWMVDTAERALSTYLEVFLGLLIASWSTSKIDLTVVATAAWSAVPALLAVAKAAFADFRSNTVSPASLVKER